MYQIYEAVLLEGNVERCFALFGNELFGDELGGNEKNTPIENRYHDEIIDFTDNMYGEAIKPEFIKMIKRLKGCINKYPDVLIPDDSSIYRGTMIPLEYFVNKKELINVDGCNKYQYKALSQVQSWTVNHTIANGFGDNSQINSYASKLYLDEYDTPLKRQELLGDLLKNKIYLAFRLNYHTNKDDFLFKSKYFNYLSYNGDEDEILRINNGPITVDACLKINMVSGVNKRGYELLKLVNLAIMGK